MGSIIIEGFPEESTPRAESPWGNDELGIQVDEMFARRLDNEMADGIHAVLDHPETGLFAKRGEDALAAIPDAMRALDRLRQQTLGQALGERQGELARPAIEARLEAALRRIGGLSRRTTDELDEEISEGRIARFKRDAAAAWDDAEQLRLLGRAVVTERRHQGERSRRNAQEIQSGMERDLSDLYASAVERAADRSIDDAERLYLYSRDVMDADRRQAIERRLAARREDESVGAIERALLSLPLDAEFPPIVNEYRARAEELMVPDASPQVRARIGRVAESLHATAFRAWDNRRAKAAIQALDSMRAQPSQTPDILPSEILEHIAPEDWLALHQIARDDGRVVTDRFVYDWLEAKLVYAPDAFLGESLDRYRLRLDDSDFGRLSGFQVSLAKGEGGRDAAQVAAIRRRTDDLLEHRKVDLDSPAAYDVRFEVRRGAVQYAQLQDRQIGIQDIDHIVERGVENVSARGIARNPEPPPGSIDPTELPIFVPTEKTPQDAHPRGNWRLTRPERNDHYLTFDGKRLTLYKGEKEIDSWPAVSGAPGAQGWQDQQSKYRGPLPEGVYDVSPRDLQYREGFKAWIDKQRDVDNWPGGHHAWGDNRVWIRSTPGQIPSGRNYGRDNFSIHGGVDPGSAGCIDLTSEMPKFVARFRKMNINVKLYVNYPGSEMTSSAP